ncbi:hypothetical protein [Actinokineospora enzanensis]|uniref:hypothetical protein n=1 Tax=Actinokineospora enzanensis TaxID=155975 RepID=UPI00037C3ED2|nr:hypothetical protein [Actinokineospora enzanensis]
MTADERARAVLATAAAAHDADDLRLLLDMLGLRAQDAYPAKSLAAVEPVPLPRPRRDRELATRLLPEMASTVTER